MESNSVTALRQALHKSMTVGLAGKEGGNLPVVSVPEHRKRASDTPANADEKRRAGDLAIAEQQASQPSANFDGENSTGRKSTYASTPWDAAYEAQLLRAHAGQPNGIGANNFSGEAPPREGSIASSLGSAPFPHLDLPPFPRRTDDIDRAGKVLRLFAQAAAKSPHSFSQQSQQQLSNRVLTAEEVATNLIVLKLLKALYSKNKQLKALRNSAPLTNFGNASSQAAVSSTGPHRRYFSAGAAPRASEDPTGIPEIHLQTIDEHLDNETTTERTSVDNESNASQPVVRPLEERRTAEGPPPGEFYRRTAPRHASKRQDSLGSHGTRRTTSDNISGAVTPMDLGLVSEEVRDLKLCLQDLRLEIQDLLNQANSVPPPSAVKLKEITEAGEAAAKVTAQLRMVDQNIQTSPSLSRGSGPGKITGGADPPSLRIGGYPEILPGSTQNRSSGLDRSTNPGFSSRQFHSIAPRHIRSPPDYEPQDLPRVKRSLCQLQQAGTLREGEVPRILVHDSVETPRGEGFKVDQIPIGPLQTAESDFQSLNSPALYFESPAQVSNRINSASSNAKSPLAPLLEPTAEPNRHPPRPSPPYCRPFHQESPGSSPGHHETPGPRSPTFDEEDEDDLNHPHQQIHPSADWMGVEEERPDDGDDRLRLRSPGSGSPSPGLIHHRRRELYEEEMSPTQPDYFPEHVDRLPGEQQRRLAANDSPPPHRHWNYSENGAFNLAAATSHEPQLAATPANAEDLSPGTTLFEMPMSPGGALSPSSDDIAREYAELPGYFPTSPPKQTPFDEEDDDDDSAAILRHEEDLRRDGIFMPESLPTRLSAGGDESYESESPILNTIKVGAGFPQSAVSSSTTGRNFIIHSNRGDNESTFVDNL